MERNKSTTTLSSWYRKFYYDGTIYVTENATESQNDISNILIYQTNQSFPGQLIGSLPVTKRWPSWEIAERTNESAYEIYYTTMNDLNQTFIVKTILNISDNTLTSSVSEDYGRSCQPTSPITIEIASKFILFKCNDLHVYFRENMKIVAITKFPNVDRTVTIEMGNQVLIYGSLYSKLYQAELLVYHFNSSSQGVTALPDVTFDLGQEYKTVLQSMYSFSV